MDAVGSVLTTPRRALPLDYTSFTIAATAGTIFSLADSGMPTRAPEGAQCFRGILETAQVRVRGDAVDPTTTEGELANPGDIVYLTADEFVRTRFIRTGSTSGVLKGHFFDRELL